MGEIIPDFMPGPGSLLASQKEKTDTKETNILIADDESIVQELLCKFLEDRGYNTLLASKGKKALDIVRNNDVRIAIVDIKMPGLDGIKTCYRLKQILQSSPSTGIIVITGYYSRENVEKSFCSGAIDIISKPFDLEDVNQ